ANGVVGFGPRFPYHADVLGTALLFAHLDEAAAHLLHHKLVSKRFDRIQLAVMPGSLQELQHEDTHALADGAQGGSHSGRGLALAGAGIHDDESATNVWHCSGFKFRVSSL